MFKQLILLSICSCFLFGCGKKNYPAAEQLTNQQLIDILVKEVGAGRVEGIKSDARSDCIFKARGNNAEREKCMGDDNPLLREGLVHHYNTYILNKSI